MSLLTHSKKVKVAFREFFFSPISSMENPSLRVNIYGGNIDVTFIVDDFIEDEFGEWVTDEVTGEQGYVDDEGSCFWTRDIYDECVWRSRPF